MTANDRAADNSRTGFDGGAIFSPDVETRAPAEQRWRDEAQYRQQIEYILSRSAFYHDKLNTAGLKDVRTIGGLADIHHLPFTEKDELRKSQADYPPFGNHLAAAPDAVRRVYSTSGTTGKPCYIAITAADLDVWTTISARSYTAAGIRRGRRVAFNYNSGPFVAGATIDTLGKIGITHIPVGTGNTDRLIGAIQRLGADAIMATPSYSLYLIDWCREHDIATETLGIAQIACAGEPGGGDPAIRSRIETAFRCKVNEAMGIGDISISLWGECDEHNGMHFSGGDNVYTELIDPATGAPVAIEDGAQGELVYTALRREAMPLLRFRSRDHVAVTARPCSCGRMTPRVRCIGRTDDMLIVRGVNLFPSALRAVVNRFSPDVGEILQIRPYKKGVRQEPPLRVLVELPANAPAPAGLAERIENAIRDVLIVRTRIELVAHGTLPRSEYKSALVSFIDAT